MTASLKQLYRQEARERRRWCRAVRANRYSSQERGAWKRFTAIRLRVLRREDAYVAAGKFVRKEG